MKPTNAAPPGEPTILSSSSPSSKSSSIGTTPPRRRAKAKAEVAAALPPWNSSSLSAATKAESFSIFDSAPSPELITSRAIPFFLQICSDSHQIILFFELGGPLRLH
ncbi:OLC1v1025502C1 [Oldenlandia corymbosa var. corymbosa]|uniref:OLC1v1025502C1 n=1 Tax=Oldenlandia corymbosa var. corymbosa TaxID=529605 RepID=A0AAV1C5U1_OLDCO|nr:OLC1v1025502C1 [Oldenlandia corymbosa var. corymbosa]